MTKRTLILALGVVLALAGIAFAQIATGNIYGVAKDESGALLPGVAVTLKSDLGTKSTVSGADGAFRFLSLDRGNYTLTLALSGFATTVRNVRVTTGENLDLTFNMKVSGVAETVEVTGESPLVDTKKRGTATTMTTDELNEMPSARDPWGVMKAVPGVLTDRVNIAGNENGQQASQSSKGSVSADTTWNIDGMTVTDMSATGASASYYDYGAFQEINMTTGGTDMTMQTGGLGVNLVTKRGTNAFHGSARYLLANHKLSFGNVSDQNQAPYSPAQLSQDPRLQNPDGTFRNQGDHIQQIGEWGFDLGGPIVKDKLWFYGTYGKQDIRLERLVGTPDKTLLDSVNGKLNWQATSKTMVSAFYFNGGKKKYGRSPGSGLQEENGVLFDQGNQYTPGGLPGGLWKLQIDQTFTPNFFMSAKAAYYDTGFGFTTRGDPSHDGTLDYVNGIYKGTGTNYLAIRPQKALNLDGSYFAQGLGGSHELKFGFGYRDLSSTSSTTWPGDGLVGHVNGTGPDDNTAIAYRDYTVRYSGKYTDVYVGDMFTKDRWTINLGVRFDKQTAKNDQSEAVANKALADMLPTASYTGSSSNLQDWTTWSPRVGLSFALDEARKTVLRASYARYYQQLSFGDVALENPVNYSYEAFPWHDLNGDGFPSPNEVDSSNLLYWGGINPSNPSTVSDTVAKVDRNRKPKYDDEFIVGVDHELLPNFAIGAAFTYRVAGDWNATARLAGVCGDASNPTLATCPVIAGSQYIANAPKTVTVGGQDYTAFTYSPPADLYTAGQGGTIRTTRPDYKTHFTGFELTANKRLSGKWMARVAFSYQNWTNQYSSQEVNGHFIPAFGNPTWAETESFVNGDAYGAIGGGSGKRNFYTSFKWQVYANALYQLPWGVDLSGTFWGRQGAAAPLFLLLSGGKDGNIRALAVPSVVSNRFGNNVDLDLRLAKTFKFGKQPYLTVAAEWFNVLNSGVVLGSQRQVNAAAYNRIDEILSPSIFRIGATFGF